MTLWYLSQIGRREHYALARELFSQKKLRLLCTDVWLPHWARPFASFLPQKLKARFHPDLVDSQVIAYPLWTALTKFSQSSGGFESWVRDGEAFGKFVATKFLKAGLNESSTVLGYTCGNLEQIMIGRSVNANTIHIQIDPGPAWYGVRKQEQAKYPQLECESPFFDARFFDRIAKEIETANHVVVHSEHSRRSLAQAGFKVSHISVIPPAFYGHLAAPKEECALKKLKALYVGNICLAKGFHIFAEAARNADNEFEFLAAGKHSMRAEYISKCSRHVTFVGQLSYPELQKLFNQADVLVFPTLSDGFGLVQLEAMAMGLPVVATPNCGDVVIDGQNGFIVPVGCHLSILDKLKWFKVHSEEFSEFSKAAIRRVSDFSPTKQIALMERLSPQKC